MEGGSSPGAQNLEHVQFHEVNKNTQGMVLGILKKSC